MAAASGTSRNIPQKSGRYPKVEKIGRRAFCRQRANANPVGPAPAVDNGRNKSTISHGKGLRFLLAFMKPICALRVIEVAQLGDVVTGGQSRHRSFSG
jgi:hypothetical protein